MIGDLHGVRLRNFDHTIMQAWQDHSDKHPVIECDLASRTVTADPAEQYMDGLSERTQRIYSISRV